MKNNINNNNKKIISITKTPQFEFKIIESFIAGIVLTGNEIKSIRKKEVSIKESYVLSKNFELYIFNMYISNYSNASIQPNVKFDERAKRKLLLKKSEIKKITKGSKEKKYSIIPLKVFVSERG
jgi:SsrA-binding protein